MAEISFGEKKIIEDFLEMGGGYVLNFSDRTFSDFMGSEVEIAIDDDKYKLNGTSKANRLRTFFRLEDNYTVGKALKSLYDYKLQTLSDEINDNAIQFCKIAEKLKSGGIVKDIDAIQAINDDKDFHQLAKLTKESIERNEPEVALDRLHSYMFKFLLALCDSHEVEYSKEETLNATYGKYIKAIRDKGFLESEMAEKIIQYCFQVMQAFSDIRNNKSFAHDNPVLNYDESVLIFANVTASVKFIQSLEEKNQNKAVEDAKPDWNTF